jgi:hypothetical protein
MVSALQKVASSQFINGDFYYYVLSRGSLFREFLNFFPEIIEITSSNSENIMDLNTKNPNYKEYIILKDAIPNLGMICRVFAWISILVEFLVAIAILWKPKNAWTHLLLIIMIIGILCTRFESGFMALLAISGLFLCKNLKLRLLYVVIIMGCVTLMVTKLGFH